MPTVLVVEDEVLIRDFIKQELESEGYTVFEAGHADAAIAVLEAHRDIRFVFTDIDMPGSMDGLKLAAYVRDRWPPIHIIVTTGNSRPLTLPSGAMFIAKPYRSDTIVTAIQTFENW